MGAPFLTIHSKGFDTEEQAFRFHPSSLTDIPPNIVFVTLSLVFTCQCCRPLSVAIIPVAYSVHTYNNLTFVFGI